MKGARQRSAPSGAKLEADEAKLSEELDQLLLFDPNSSNSNSELKEISRKLKNLYAEYTSVVVQYVQYLRSIGAPSEASDFIDRKEFKRAPYQNLIQSIKTRRDEVAGEDEVISEVSSFSNFDSDQQSVMSVNTKIKRFLDSSVRNISDKLHGLVDQSKNKEKEIPPANNELPLTANSASPAEYGGVSGAGGLAVNPRTIETSNHPSPTNFLPSFVPGNLQATRRPHSDQGPHFGTAKRTLRCHCDFFANRDFVSLYMRTR